ncbi:MAG: hypothetical protein ACFFDK_15200 [Promethearchaeota archaeon]
MKTKGEKYNYVYMQFAVSPSERNLIKSMAEKERYKTTSEFLRRLIFDYIRREENPELINGTNDGNLNSIILEDISKNIREALKNQEIILDREDAFEQMRKMVVNIHKLVEAGSLEEERNIITQLLKEHNSLTIHMIQEETGLPKDVIFKIISDMNIFKLTTTGRFTLR